MNIQQLTDRFIEFSTSSMAWCIQESEKDTTNVHTVILSIMNDVRRRNSLSKATLAALEKASAQIAQSAKDSDASIGKVVDFLKQLSEDQREINELMDPIIQALQFQDRFRQNLENLGKMLHIWNAGRRASMNLTEFGSKLLDATTSPDERQVIRQFIPNLPDEATPNDVSFF